MRVSLTCLGELGSSTWDSIKEQFADDLQRMQATINNVWAVSHNVDGTQKIDTALTTVKTWNPVDASGANLVLGFNTPSTYVKNGPLVTASASINFPATASGAVLKLTGLPFTCGLMPGGAIIAYANNGIAGLTGYVRPGLQNIEFYTYGASVTNNQVTAGTLQFTVIYAAQI